MSLICTIANSIGLGSNLLTKVIQLCKINNIIKLFGFGVYEGSRNLYKKFAFNEYNELIFKGGNKNTKSVLKAHIY